MDFSKEYISYKSALEASKQCSQYTGAAVSIVRTETGTWLIKSSKPMTPDQVEIVAERRQEESRRSASESEEQAKFESPVLSGAIVGINPYRLFESQRDRQIIGSYDRHTSIFCRMCGGDGGPGGAVFEVWR